MKKASFLILAIIVLIMASLSIRSAYCDESKIIEVQNIEIKKLPAEHNFIGINWSNASKNRPIFDNQTYRDELTDVLKTLGTDIVRYPGGQNILTNFWNITDEDVLTALRKLPAQDREWINPSATATKNIDFISFIKFCENSSIKAEVQVNTHNYFDEENKEIKYLKNYERDSNGQRIFNTGKIDWELVQKAANSAAEQVKWVKLNGNSKIVNYWELGNEDYHKLKMNCAYTGTEYGKVAGIFLKTMVSADPSIKVIITNNDWIQNWSKDVMSDPDVRKYRKNIYAVSNHIYGYGKTEKDFSYYAFKKNILTNPELDLQNRLNFHKTLLKDTDFADTKIFLNEFNLGFYLDPFIHTWLGAIGDSEMILSCANMPSCSHADFHELFMNWCGSDDIYENKGFGLVHFAKDFTKPFLINPNVLRKGFIDRSCSPDIWSPATGVFSLQK